MLNPPDEQRITVLAGAGLSLPSGVPSYRHHNGMWEGHHRDDVATLSAWRRDPASVRRFHDAQRTAVALAMPNSGHLALARLQQRWGEKRVTLITQNVDSLLDKAGAPKVIEVYGSLFRLRCEADATHPAVGVFGDQNPAACCKLCGAALRPDVRWDDEPSTIEPELDEALSGCQLLLVVGASSTREPAAGFIARARAAGARVIEVNVEPHAELADEVLAGPAEDLVPALVGAWLGEDQD